jgi:hypothetical protein
LWKVRCYAGRRHASAAAYVAIRLERFLTLIR